MGMNFVFGIYKAKSDIELTIQKLKGEGFRNTDVSVLFIQDARPEAPGHTIGDEIGWLAVNGLIIVPGHGKCVVAGPLKSALSCIPFASPRLGITEGAQNGIVGGLLKLGLPEYEAKRYSLLTHSGRMLLAVHTEEEGWLKKATAVLTETGIEDMATSIQNKDIKDAIDPRPNP